MHVLLFYNLIVNPYNNTNIYLKKVLLTMKLNFCSLINLKTSILKSIFLQFNKV